MIFDAEFFSRARQYLSAIYQSRNTCSQNQKAIQDKHDADKYMLYKFARRLDLREGCINVGRVLHTFEAFILIPRKI